MSGRYRVRAETQDGVEVWTLEETGRTTAQVIPAWGNNGFAYTVQQPVLDPVTLAELRPKPTAYGFPILFPFPNRIRDGVFTFEGQTFHVEPQRHGFVRDKAWNVVGSGSSEAEGAWMEATLDAVDYPEAILRQFPFPFRIAVTHRLREGALEIETVVTNTAETTLPFGLGFHPYFRRPAHGTLTLAAQRRWQLEESLPTGTLLELEGNYDLRTSADLNTLELDDIYTDLVPDADGLVRCNLEDHDAGLRTVVEFDPVQFPHVVLFTPPAPRQALCIEPLTCPTDAFNLRERGIRNDVRLLAPGATDRFLVRTYSEPLT